MTTSTETQPQSTESVGTKYDNQKFDLCRSRAWDLLFALSKKIKAGMTEADGHLEYKKLCQEFGVEKNWHPAKIRFGRNSTKGFREISDETVVLQENDIFFLDIGPVYFDHEGDVGKTFVLGHNADFLKVKTDSEEIWKLVARHWKEKHSSGPELYRFAEEQAEQRGWKLNLYGASGHRIGDFPHAVFHKGNLKDFEEIATPDRWILEIQIRHPELEFGAFFEDVLR